MDGQTLFDARWRHNVEPSLRGASGWAGPRTGFVFCSSAIPFSCAVSFVLGFLLSIFSMFCPVFSGFVVVSSFAFLFCFSFLVLSCSFLFFFLFWFYLSLSFLFSFPFSSINTLRKRIILFFALMLQYDKKLCFFCLFLHFIFLYII